MLSSTNQTQSFVVEAHRLYRNRDYDQLSQICQLILSQDPRNADAYYLLGGVALHYNDTALAVQLIQQSLTINSQQEEALLLLGVAYRAAGKLDEATASYQRMLSLNPKSWVAYSNLGIVERERNNHQQSIDAFRKAIAINPDAHAIHNNLGNTYQLQGDIDQAAEAYQQALKLKPDYTEALTNLGNIYLDQQEIKQAIEQYRKAIAVAPDDADPHHHLSLALLVAGRWDEGWKMYERGLALRPDGHRRSFGTIPEWDGRPLQHGERLLIWDDQGVGDEVMFASCLGELFSSVDPAQCIIECDPRLLPIYRRSFPQSNFVARDPTPGLPAGKIHFESSMMHLTALYRTDTAAFPSVEGYLQPSPELTAHWRQQLDELPGGMAIGIAWRGGNTTEMSTKRNTQLEQWLPILKSHDASFINLQYGDCQQEITDFKRETGITIHHWNEIDPLKELDNYLALINALDLIIQIDNTSAHLSGAIGKPVWNMVPYKPEWRWLLQQERTLWYPSMKLYRQGADEDWSRTIQTIALDLSEFNHSTTTR